MIRSYFGLPRNPFAPESLTLLPFQQDIFETLKVHCQQGGLCLLLGEPGTGKSSVKQALKDHDPKRLITPTVNFQVAAYGDLTVKDSYWTTSVWRRPSGTGVSLVRAWVDDEPHPATQDR